MKKLIYYLKFSLIIVLFVFLSACGSSDTTTVTIVDRGDEEAIEIIKPFLEEKGLGIFLGEYRGSGAYANIDALGIKSFEVSKIESINIKNVSYSNVHLKTRNVKSTSIVKACAADTSFIYKLLNEIPGFKKYIGSTAAKSIGVLQMIAYCDIQLTDSNNKITLIKDTQIDSYFTYSFFPELEDYGEVVFIFKVGDYSLTIEKVTMAGEIVDCSNEVNDSASVVHPIKISVNKSALDEYFAFLPINDVKELMGISNACYDDKESESKKVIKPSC